MDILFWGTPAYAVASLDALVDAGHRICGAVSQPDRRRGRGKELGASAVKARALNLGIPVFTPERIRSDGACQQELAALGADISVVVAFGQILPPEVLNQPPLGCWNGHGSLLPRWRGAAPIQWSLLEGDSQTGVGIMAMEAGLDTGPVLLERAIPLGLLQNAQHLAEKLAQLTAELLVEALPLIGAAGPGPESERLERLGVRPQEAQAMTYARMLEKADFPIDWSRPALAIHRQVMGLYPAASCQWQGKRFKVHGTEPLIERLGEQLSPEVRPLLERHGNQKKGAPGTLIAVEEGLGLVVATGGCPLLVRSGQLEGKGPSGGQSMVQQLAAKAGDCLN